MCLPENSFFGVRRDAPLASGLEQRGVQCSAITRYRRVSLHIKAVGACVGRAVGAWVTGGGGLEFVQKRVAVV